MQDEKYGRAASALRRGDVREAGISSAEGRLLEFVETVTLHAYRVSEDQLDGLRSVGWRDDQIAEAVYVAALFNLFVRLADSFGIDPPPEYEPEGIPPVVMEATSPTDRVSSVTHAS